MDRDENPGGWKVRVGGEELKFRKGGDDHKPFNCIPS